MATERDRHIVAMPGLAWLTRVASKGRSTSMRTKKGPMSMLPKWCALSAIALAVGVIGAVGPHRFVPPTPTA